MLLTVVGLLSMSLPLRASEHKTLLVINAYNENDPWVSEMLQPIMLYLATIPDVSADVCNLNLALLSDTTEYAQLVDNTIERYQANPPVCVVMIGSQAFDMRASIKNAWGDMPMLLISTKKDYALPRDFFNPSIIHKEFEPNHMLQLERENYNFTAIIIPEFYKETVDMMVQMMPKMQEIVFISDSMYVNRRLANCVHQYINEQYPTMKFSWLKANQSNADTLQNYMVSNHADKGLLMSSWLYEREDASGVSRATSNELKMVSASRTPIFTLRESYMTTGSVGGVYADQHLAVEREIEVIEMMLAGKDLRKEPFYVVDQSYPRVNYRILKKYGMSEKNCPAGTVFISKPETFLSKYRWQIIAFFLLLIVTLLYLTMKNHEQRKKIAAYARNKEFVDAMPIAYSNATIRYDSEGNVVTIDYTVKNAAFTKIVDDNMVIGSPYLLFPANFIAPKVTELIKEHKTQVFTYHFTQTDTYYQFMFCLVSNPLNVKGKGKNISQIDVFAVDMTKRNKMEMQLVKTKRKLDITLNVSNLIPWQYDIKADVVTYDHYTRTSKFARSMDIHNEELSIPFAKFLTLIHPDDRKVMQGLRDDLRTGKIKEFNVRYRRLSDTNTRAVDWCEMLGAVTENDSQGNSWIATGSIEYITDSIEQQQKMEQALERANESDRMKSAFLANMSHEIRTPLNAIVGFSNVIAYTQDESERLEFCDLINKNNEQLLSLIDDVLDLAKIESNTVDINYEECDLNEMMDHIEATMQKDVPKGVILKAIKGSNECLAQVDQVRVKQILCNLISNSCKFTEKGNITFGYEINDNDRLYFFVRDSGRGISKENQEKIFQRFVKLDSFVPGTGLGLSICRSLVDKMGGEMGVESAGEGKGSMFWFVLPYIPAQSAVNVLSSESFFKQYVPNQFLHSNNKKIKVLIAEDNDGNYKLLEHLLGHFELMRAANGQEAVEAYLKFKPDVILMDITMPEVDGYEAFDRIRSLSAKVPIVAVTANVYDSDRRNILNHGFDAYVSKPITQRAIINAIGHVLTSYRGRNQD